MDGTSHVAPERFIEEARAALVESSRRLVEDWRLGSESRWEVDLTEGQVSFHFDDGTILYAPIQVVGTYNARDGTFLWAWGHKTLPRHLVAHAGLARAWGRENDMADYTAAIVDCTPEAVWDFAAVTAHLAGREGVYRGRNGSVWLYLTYGDIAMEAAHRADAAVTAAAPDRVEGSRSTSRPPSLSPRAASAASRNPGRFSADFGGVVERGLQRLQTQIGGVVHRPVDCARVSSRLRLSLARRRGQLEPLELMPTHARIGRDDDHLNTVYVPPYFAEQKRRIDLLITAGLVRHGIGSPGYVATPVFAGRSLVPASIQIEVSGPMDCWTVLRIWEPGAYPASDPDDEDAYGPETAALADPAQTQPGPQALPGPRPVSAPVSTLPVPHQADEPDPISEEQPRSIVEAFIRDCADGNLDAVEGQDGSDSGAHREARGAHRDYQALLERYCADGVKPGEIAFGTDAIFDPGTARVVAEVFLGDRALVVVGSPSAAGNGRFHTCDFEFVLDTDRWLLVDVAVVDGFDRLSMLRRHRPLSPRSGDASARPGRLMRGA